MKEFPRPDLPIKEKFKINPDTGVYQYAMDCIDYAIEQHMNRRRGHITKMNKLYRKFNGDYPGYAMTYLNKTYGPSNIAKYVDYRLCRPKLEKLIGEFIDRPLNSTVFTVNKTAQMAKLDQYYIMLGLAAAKPQIEQLRNEYGPKTVMEGMPVPDKATLDNYWTSISSKSKNEITMQYLINNFTKVNRDYKYQLSTNYRDVIIVAEAHGKVSIDKKGKVCYDEIDPRDAIFLENDRDPYCKTSPYRGRKKDMFLHQIIAQHNLTKPQIDKLVAEGHIRQSDFNTSATLTRNEGAGPLTYEVFNIQWKTLHPFITKKTLERNKNVFVEEPYEKDVPIDSYIQNFDEIEKDVNAKKYTIDIKWKETLWEVTRIGQKLYVDAGPKTNVMGSLDSPYETKYEYVSFLSNTVNGVRISIKELCDDVEEQYNIVRFQINRELVKMKGTAFTYDRAFLPKGTTMKAVLHQIINDGFMDYSSSEEGNMGGETKDPKDAFKTIDLGASTSLPVLLQIAQNLEMLAESISGISNQRLGDIKASETSGNAQSAIANSQLLTEPINYGFDIFVEDSLVLIMEQMKIAVLINPDWGTSVVGEQGKELIEISQDLSSDDYGNYLVNIRKEQEVRNRAMGLAEQAINSGEMRVHDLMKADLEETVTGAIAVLEQGWVQIQEVGKQQAAAEAEQAQKDRDQALQLAREDREDRQAHEIELAKIKAGIAAAAETQMSANKHFIEQEKIRNKGTV